MKVYLVGVFFLFSLVAVAQGKSSHSQSMGSVSIYDDYHSNCSFTALLKQPEISLGYNNSFFLSELGETVIHASLPASKVFQSYTMSAFGYSDYNDIAIKASLARLLTPRMAAGISATYLLHHHVGSDDIMSGFKVAPGVYWYFAEDNLLSCYTEIGNRPKNQDKSEVTYSVYIAYNLTINTYVNWATEIGLEEKNFVGKMGFCYDMDKVVSLRCGASVMPIRPSAGIGIKIDCFEISYATDYCNTLGISMSTGLKWKIQEKKRDAK